MKRLPEDKWDLVFRGQKRHLKELKRRYRLQKKSKKQIDPYHSKVIDILSRNGKEGLNKYKKKSLTLDIPKSFSLIENPSDSLALILNFCRDFRNKNIREIIFDHSNVNNIDLSAECVLGCITNEIKKETARKTKKVKPRGTYPSDQNKKRLIRAVGVVRNLDIEHEYLDDDEIASLRIFRSRYQKTTKEAFDRASYKERVLKNFVDHINSCLKDHNRVLKDEACGDLLDYAGEIIANAEEHAGFNDWTIVGYLDNKEPEHYCEITIFNFGKSISDTFKGIPTDSITHREISPYIDAHKKRSLFGPGWTEDNLLTLAALQGNISSKNYTPDDHRGTGTVDLIGFFQQVHHECSTSSSSCAKMAILSGDTYIYFDGKYQMMADPESQRPVIAFNRENSLKNKPDKNYVKKLPGIFFPGTLIGIKFPLSVEEQTEEIEDA